MTSRRKSGLSVSLFPFLAVLVCAMGALILLLLVTTRRLRLQAEDRAQAALLADTLPAVHVPPAAPLPGLPSNDDVPAVPAAPVLSIDPLDNEPLLPEFAPEPMSPPVIEPDPDAERLALEARWRARVARLEDERAVLERELRAGRSALSAQQSLLLDSRQVSDQIEQQQSAIVERLRALDDETRKLIAEQAAIQLDLSRTEQQITQTRAEQVLASRRLSIVPYDGRSGTTRRPIIIECRADGLTFVSEGITIKPEDLDGYSRLYNPLLAGTRALVKYWGAHPRPDADMTSDAALPYVLLVIRPGGTTGYYVAREMLEPLESPFGYELVTNQQQFAWPDSTPEAQAVCRQAIDNVLRNRGRVAGTSPLAETPNPLAPTTFSNARGEFHLDEVDRLRNPERTVYFGGQRFDRSTHTLPPTPGTRGSGRTSNDSSPSRTTSSPPTRPMPAAASRTSPAATGGGRAPLPDAARPMPDGSPGSARAPAASTASSGSTAPSSSSLNGRPPAAASPTGNSATASDAARQYEPADLWRRPGSSRPQAPGDAERERPPGTPPAANSPGASASRMRRSEEVDPQQPQWGIRAPGSTIGFERRIEVHVSAREIVIAGSTTIPIQEGTSHDELQRALARALDEHILNWGPPPQSFFWQPAIHFVVGPGGNQYEGRLETVVKEWGLRSSVQYVLE